ncbi:MAG TPA: sulfatase, partial [Candidatus Hydrogenedentes bacterium]|nr:sulfatase [Candidatus Hydrogenedentota bacterium]
MKIGYGTPLFLMFYAAVTPILGGCGNQPALNPTPEKLAEEVAAILDTVLSAEIQPNKRPNVLWIVLDACRAKQLSCYGYERPTTPIIDEIARQGTRFARHYAQSYCTYYSVPSYLTGRYFVAPCLEEGDVNYPPAQLMPEDRLLPERFRENGYFTWCVTGHPLFSRRARIAKAFEKFDVLTPARPHVNKVTFEQLNEHIRETSGPLREPYFLYVHAMDTHFPHVVLPPFDRWVPRNKAETVVTGKGEEAARFFDRPLTSNEYQTLLGVYDGDLAYADYQIGILLKTLHDSKALDNTIIIISSDHGELLGEGKMIGHPSQPPDELLHVPCVMAGPGLNRGAVITSLTENTDLAPTLAALCRLNENHADFEGFSLTGLLRGSADLHLRPYALSSLKLRFGHYAIHTGEALYVFSEFMHSFARVSYTSKPEGSPPEWTLTPAAADEPLIALLSGIRNRHLCYLTRPADCQYITLSPENIDAGCRSRITSIGGAYPGQNEQPKNSWLLINDNLWCSSPDLEPLRLRIPWNPRQSATVHARFLYGPTWAPPR